MTGIMPRPLPPFLHREITRHKRPVWYFRRAKGKRIRIPGEFGSAEFNAAYDAALNGIRPQRAGPAQGTFARALAAYKQSQAWGAPSPATQRQRINVFKHIEAAHGGSKVKDWGRAEIAAGRDKRAAKPAAAGMFLKAMRGFFKWALEAGLVSSDPTEGVKVATVATEGFVPWTEDDVAAYRARWRLGTHQRVALEVLHETGLRRGDAVRVGPTHVRDGVIRLMTEKTGERVSIAITDILARALEAGLTGDQTFIVGAGGKPLVKESFTNMFRIWAKAAGVDKSPHGLRKAAATADAMDGYSDAELSAKFGWTGRQMASLYTRSANREKLSLEAARRTKERTKIPAPSPKSAGLTIEESGDFDSLGAPSRHLISIHPRPRLFQN
jgi:integrase